MSVNVDHLSFIKKIPEPKILLVSQVIGRMNEFSDYNQSDHDIVYSSVFDCSPSSFSDSELDDIQQFIIFKCRPGCKAKIILETFQKKFPHFPFTGIRSVLSDIILDLDVLSLSLDLVVSKLKEQNCDGFLSRNQCVDFAFELMHPNIVMPPYENVKISEYVINFLWINLDAQDRKADLAEHVFGDGTFASEQISFISNLSRWAQIHEGVNINLWIDTALVTRRAFEQTVKVIQDLSESKRVNLSVRDVRSLKKVQTTMQRYFHPSIPVYFRVDLAKALIVDELMRLEMSGTNIVVSDIDITPKPSNMIFDRKTVEFLSVYGYVFNRCGINLFENSFLIFEAGREPLCGMHEKYIIDSLGYKMDLALSAINLNDTTVKNPLRFDSQKVFNGYGELLFYMEGLRLGIKAPRIVVLTPPSRFNYRGDFADDLTDHKNELFLLKNDSEIPYVCHGRSLNSSCYLISQKYADWVIEPVSLLSS